MPRRKSVGGAVANLVRSGRKQPQRFRPGSPASTFPLFRLHRRFTLRDQGWLMPFPALIFPILISVAAAEEPPITVQGYPWAPFISPMGEPFRARSTSEAPIARWFGQADRNRDGVLTSDEMQADADRFFARLDSSRDGMI